MLASNELHMYATTIFVPFYVTKFQDWGLHTIVKLMCFYKFKTLHLKSKTKNSFQ